MAKHNMIGQMGEQLAVGYFKENGYDLLHKNWRSGHWEIDLIAAKNGVLHFIEVKTKSNHKHGYPEDEVDTKKIKYMISAAEDFLWKFPTWKRIQFDVLAITLHPTTTFFLIEDVYI